MHGFVQEFVRRRKRVNYALLKRIQEIHCLPGFTGERTRGVHVGHSDEEPQNDPSVSVTAGEEGQDIRGVESSDGEDDIEVDNELQWQVNGIENFIVSVRG